MTNSNESSKAYQKKNRKLILHFDQHNTIQVACTLPGRNITVEEGVNHFLTTAVWGKEEGNKWIWLSERPEKNKPPNQPCAITYFKYLEKKLVGTPNDRAELKKKTCRFVYEEPGCKYRNFFDLYLQSLTYPRKNNNYGIYTPNYYNSNGSNLPPNTIPAGDPSNNFLYHLILPEFFDMIRKLQKENRDFTIVLRTMGIDSQNFLDTVRPVFEGKHPDFQDIKPIKINSNIGKIQRFDDNKIVLTMDNNVYDNEEKIYDKLSCLEGINAIRDDFAFWQKNKYECYSAKPLWINLNDPDHHHIIFDDNIRLDSIDDCIVNIRLLNSSEKKKFVDVHFNSYKFFKSTSILQPDLIELLNPNLKIDSNCNHYLNMIKNAEKSYENLLKEKNKLIFYLKDISEINKFPIDIKMSDSLDCKINKSNSNLDEKNQSSICGVI